MAKGSLPPLAPGPAAAPHSGIREIAGLAMSTPGSIRLDVGQPDFTTPVHIMEAAKRAIDEGHHYYTPTKGMPALRERIAVKLERVNGISVDPEQIACTPGGVGALAATLAALVAPGDEVLLPDPCWPNYRQMLGWTYATGVYYPCPAESGFLPDLDRLVSLISSRTRVLLINSPNNPTGAVYPREVLDRLAEIAEERGLWLVSDECYDEILFDGPTTSMGKLLGDGRVVTIFTFSKTYAMTGWRLGYAVGSDAVIDSVTKVLESNSSCTSTISQMAAIAALDGPQDCVGDMVAAYSRRRDLSVDLLGEAGLLMARPQGAFYVMADVRPSGLASRDFTLRLLKERGVSVAPGSAFGDVAADGVRISLASSDADLREGIGRLCEAVRDGGA